MLSVVVLGRAIYESIFPAVGNSKFTGGLYIKLTKIPNLARIMEDKQMLM